MNGKKILYIALFTLLGVLVQFFIHAVVEIVYIKLLLSHYEPFGLGFEFATWFTIHTIYTGVLLLLGIGVGFWQGLYWWPRLYERN